MPLNQIGNLIASECTALTEPLCQLYLASEFGVLDTVLIGKPKDQVTRAPVVRRSVEEPVAPRDREGGRRGYVREAERLLHYASDGNAINLS